MVDETAFFLLMYHTFSGKQDELQKVTGSVRVSRRRCGELQKVATFRPRGSGLLPKGKSYGYFSEATKQIWELWELWEKSMCRTAQRHTAACLVRQSLLFCPPLLSVFIRCRTACSLHAHSRLSAYVPHRRNTGTGCKQFFISGDSTASAAQTSASTQGGAAQPQKSEQLAGEVQKGEAAGARRGFADDCNAIGGKVHALLYHFFWGEI